MGILSLKQLLKVSRSKTPKKSSKNHFERISKKNSTRGQQGQQVIKERLFEILALFDGVIWHGRWRPVTH